MGPYQHLMHISASPYRNLQRSEPKYLPEIQRQLDLVINAQPTQIHPEERAAYLETLIDDLRPGGVWSLWPEDVYTQALVAVKVLGRNPVGSGEVMLKPETLTTLVYHTCLAFPGRGRGSALAGSPPALEALRVIANTLVLHPIARKKLARMGGAEAIARALADELPTDRLFLLCRVGFLITADGSGVEEIVDNEHIVPRIVYHIHANRPTPLNYDALSELLKFSGNIIREYHKTSEEWDPTLSPLLYPILSVVHNVPFSDLAPPLTHALHALLSVPFTPELLPTWYAVPTPAVEEKRRPSKSIFSVGRRRGSPKESVSPAHSRRGSTQEGLHAPQPPSRSPSPTPSEEGSRTSLLTPRGKDPSALPRRLMSIMTTFVDNHLPGNKEPSAELTALDEILPPIFALAAHAAIGSPEMRSYMHDALLPYDLDRSPQAGPLESRPGLLGTLLRFMNSHVHMHCRDTAGELIWAVCGGDEGTVCDEIGYGIAAGLLLRKGISGPPPARIRPIPSGSPSSQSSSSSHSKTKSTSGFVPGFGGRAPRPPQKGSSPPRPSVERNPITSLESQPDKTSPLDGMTDEEKEREAEKLFVLFDRLERNPVLTAGAPTPEGGTQSLRSAMQQKVAEGVLDDWERKEAERERLEAEKEADEIEAEAMQELAEYKRRMGRR